MRLTRCVDLRDPRRRRNVALSGALFLALVVVIHIATITVAVWFRVDEVEVASVLTALWVASLIALTFLFRGGRKAIALMRSKNEDEGDA